jgi:hypothetical protein
VLVVRELRRAGIVSSDGSVPVVAALPHSSETPAAEKADEQTQRAPEQKP